MHFIRGRVIQCDDSVMAAVYSTTTIPSYPSRHHVDTDRPRGGLLLCHPPPVQPPVGAFFSPLPSIALTRLLSSVVRRPSGCTNEEHEKGRRHEPEVECLRDVSGVSYSPYDVVPRPREGSSKRGGNCSRYSRYSSSVLSYVHTRVYGWTNLRDGTATRGKGASCELYGSHASMYAVLRSLILKGARVSLEKEICRFRGLWLRYREDIAFDSVLE